MGLILMLPERFTRGAWEEMGLNAEVRINYVPTPDSKRRLSAILLPGLRIRRVCHVCPWFVSSDVNCTNGQALLILVSKCIVCVRRRVRT